MIIRNLSCSTERSIPFLEERSFKEQLTWTLIDPTDPAWENLAEKHSIFKIQTVRLAIYYICSLSIGTLSTEKILQALLEDPQNTKPSNVLIGPDNQFTYSNPNIACQKRDARASCGSCALVMLALLRNNTAKEAFNKDILGIGFQLHRSFGITNAKGETDIHAYAFTDQIIGNVNGVEESPIPILYETSGDQKIRFQNLLNTIDNESGGLLQIGCFFLMCKKHHDGSIEIYDSHGSCSGFDGDYGAYYARFSGSEEAADFLRVHRDLETQNGPNTLVLFHPLHFSPDFNAQDLGIDLPTE